jgi:hypothetical protein
MKIGIELGDLHSQVKSEVFDFVKRELPPNFILQAADQGILVAHKVILSAASVHFKVRWNSFHQN